MLRRHIRQGTQDVFDGLRTRTDGGQSDPEVTEQNFVVAANEHIGRLDIQVNQPFLRMRILQRRRDLLDVGDHHHRRQWNAPGMAFRQSAIRRVLHHHERRIVYHREI